MRITLKSETVPDISASTNQITARLPTPVLEHLDNAARALNRSRAEVVRQAIEYYLEDFDDLTVAVERLRDPGDPVLDWDEIKRDLFGSDQT